MKLPQSQRGNITLIAENGHPFMLPQACKDFVHDRLTHFFYPRYAKLWHISLMGGSFESKPILDSPVFVFYCSAKTVEKNAKKFARFMNRVESMMGIDGRTEAFVPNSGGSDKSAAFIAIAPNFWIRSPVSVSTYLTFIRLTPFMKLGEAYEAFIERQMNAKKYAGATSSYLRLAVANGNLQGFIERNLPCLNREGYSDYLLSNHHRGLSGYNRDGDSEFPVTEEALIALRIDERGSEMERLHAFPYKRHA